VRAFVFVLVVPIVPTVPQLRSVPNVWYFRARRKLPRREFSKRRIQIPEPGDDPR